MATTATATRSTEVDANSVPVIPTGSPLARKIAAIAGSVKGRVVKDGENTFHGYRYTTEAAMLAAVREKESELQVAIVPDVLPETIQSQPVGTKGEILTTLVVAFRVIDGESGQEFIGRMPGAGTDKLDKGPYKAVTGASKYFTQKLYRLPTGDDPETVSDAERDGHAAQAPGRSLGSARPFGGSTSTPQSSHAPQSAAAPGTTSPGPTPSPTSAGRPLGPRPVPAPAPAPAIDRAPVEARTEAQRPSPPPVATPAPEPPEPAPPAPAPQQPALDGAVMLDSVVEKQRGTRPQTKVPYVLYQVVTKAGQKLAAFDDVGEGLLGCFKNGKRVRLDVEQTAYGPKVVSFEVVL